MGTVDGMAFAIFVFGLPRLVRGVGRLFGMAPWVPDGDGRLGGPTGVSLTPLPTNCDWPAAKAAGNSPYL